MDIDKKKKKQEILDELDVEKRERRGKLNNKEQDEKGQDRRSGSDRRDNNLIGGRRKTDITKEEAKEFEKILNADETGKALDRLEKLNYRNLNDEAKKIEIKRTIGIHRLNTKRLSILMFLVIFTSLLLTLMIHFIDHKAKMKKESINQLSIIQQSLEAKARDRVDNATLENLNKIFDEEALRTGKVKTKINNEVFKPKEDKTKEKTVEKINEKEKTTENTNKE